MMGIAAGQTVANQGLGMINSGIQYGYSKRAARYQQGLDKEFAKYTYDLTNTTAQMKQLKNNNLNPTLAMGSAGGAPIVSTGNSNTSGVGMQQNKMDIGEAMQLELLNAQKENIQADTQNKLAGAGKTGAETQTIEAIRELEVEARKRGIELTNAGIDMNNEQTRKLGQEIINLETANNEGLARIVNTNENTRMLAEYLTLAKGQLEINQQEADSARMNARSNNTTANTGIYKAATERVESTQRIINMTTENILDRIEQEWKGEFNRAEMRKTLSEGTLNAARTNESKINSVSKIIGIGK